MNHHHDTDRILDWAAAATALGTIMSWLPNVAALFTIVWTGLRIYETRTVQRLLGRPVPRPTGGDE